MSTRAEQHRGRVLDTQAVSPHLVRLRLGGPGLAGFAATGVPDEWVGLVVPGQYQSRYYTVRSWRDGVLEVDVVVHDEGLVTGWVVGDCVGDEVVVTDPRGAFDPPEAAGWVMLVGDLTALPAMARAAGDSLRAGRVVSVWAEVPDDPAALAGYLPEGAEVTWLAPPADRPSGLAAVVEGLTWPEGPGYFWMGGESAQMRAIRKHLMRERRLASTDYHVMGYWRAGATRQPRSVDPGPIYRAGKAAGKSDEEIWADYDAAQEAAGEAARRG